MPVDVQDIARKAFAVLGSGRQLPPFSTAHPDFSLEEAYRVTAAVRAAREAGGELRSAARSASPTGPSGPNTESMHRSGAMSTTARRGTSEARRAKFRSVVWPNRGSSPRSCLGSRLRPRRTWTRRPLFAASTGSPTASRSCSRSSRTGRFGLPTPWTAYGLHGRLFVGPRHSPELRRDEWAREGESLVDHGVAANVLDGPLFALRHLAAALAHDRLSPPLAAGEIVTTGTLTRAFPVAAGEEWTTTLIGVPLEGARIRFV